MLILVVNFHWQQKLTYISDVHFLKMRITTFTRNLHLGKEYYQTGEEGADEARLDDQLPCSTPEEVLS